MDKRIGAQLYTVRDYIRTKEDFDETLQKLSDIGYKVIQISALGGEVSAEDVKASCDKYGMMVACTHRAFEEYKNKLDYTIDFHKTIGCKSCGLGMMPNAKTIITKQQLLNLLKELQEISQKLREAGLKFVYHNHAVEFRKIGGRYIMDYLLENTDIDLIADVYWLAVAGINPAEFLRKNKHRINMIHFKDLKVVENNSAICQVMEGNLDWDDIIAASYETDAEYALVEQDTCDNGDPFGCLETSYKNLKTKGFI